MAPKITLSSDAFVRTTSSLILKRKRCSKLLRMKLNAA